jgi:hypothetical protein
MIGLLWALAALRNIFSDHGSCKSTHPSITMVPTNKLVPYPFFFKKVHIMMFFFREHMEAQLNGGGSGTA